MVDDKLVKLQNWLKDAGLDYYVIPSNDEFHGEYVPKFNARLEYISGFDGSNGIAVISKEDDHHFFTDGRYLLQAKRDLDKKFTIKDIESESFINWLANLLSNSNAKVALDPKLHTAAQIKNLQKKNISNNLHLIEGNAVDIIWHDKPKKLSTNIFKHDIEYAGKGVKDKIDDILALLEKSDVSAAIFTDPHAVCWLLNIRGDDLDFTPIALSYAIIYKSGSIKVFFNNLPTEEILCYFLDNGVKVFSMHDFKVESMDIEGKVLLSKNTSHWVASLFSEHSIDHEGELELHRAIKNKREIDGAIQAHIKDGAALQAFFNWLPDNMMGLTELDISKKLLEFRAKQMGFVSPSFDSIVGFREHGAIIHYKPTAATNKKIQGSGILLIDSGGQYYEGTTDVTRTIAIGEPTEEQMRDFTLVLKGHIRLASHVFKEGTTGSDLDNLARQDLHQEGKDYAHGTGHGVGSFLSVHEGPHGINKYNKIPLVPGMMLSIEPGFYKEGEYGIRIENLVYVSEAEQPGYLKFEMLTRVPIDEKLVDFNVLNEHEKRWLKKYNEWCLL